MKIGTDAVILSALTDVGTAQSVLDIGCGCGVVAFCIAQQIAQKQPFAEIWGVDPDFASIEEANGNAKMFPLFNPQCFHFLQTPVQKLALLPIAQYDLIISNPPFFKHSLKPKTAGRRKSKHQDDQLTFQELVDSVRALLKPEGQFSVILPRKESEEFDALIDPYLHCFQRIEVQPNVNKPPHRVIQQYTYDFDRPCKTWTLIIRDGDNHYTPEYLQIVKPYLLLKKDL